MENPLIKELREALALSAGYRSEKHPGAEAVVITSQASVQAVLKELDLLRATPGGATGIHILDNGCQVTGERAANLLDDERRSHEATRNECRDLTAQRDRQNETLKTYGLNPDNLNDMLLERRIQLDRALAERDEWRSRFGARDGETPEQCRAIWQVALDEQDKLSSDLAAARALLAEGKEKLGDAYGLLNQLIGDDEPTPLIDVLRDYVAAERILRDRGYDGNGWERYTISSARAQGLIKAITKLMEARFATPSPAATEEGPQKGAEL